MVRAYGLGTSPSNRCHLLPIVIPAKWNMLFTRYLHHGQSVESRWFLLVISGTINKLSPCCTMHEEEGKQNNPLFKIKTKIEQTYIKKKKKNNFWMSDCPHKIPGFCPFALVFRVNASSPS